MQSEEIKVLLVEDNPADARLLRDAVREAGGSIHLTHVETLAKGLSRLDQSKFDVIMLDLTLPDATGLNTLVRAYHHAPAIPIVVLTGLDDEELALRAVREGAQDYLVKGQVTSSLLVRAIRYATERKRAMEALQTSEEYFRSLIENALDIITVVDDNGSIRYASPSLDRTLGFPQGTLMKTSLFDLCHPDDAERLRETLDNGSRHPGAAHQVEFRLRHRSGSWRTLEAIGKRFEAGSAVNGYVLNSRDITERRRSEEQLRKVNDTLRAVIEASPLAIYSLDLDGHVRSWNSAAQQMFGFSAEEVLYRRLPIVQPDDEDGFRRRIEDAVKGQLTAGLEQRARKRDGSTVDVSVWNAILRDEWGAVDGVVEAVADNTERKRLEEQFRQVQKMEAVGRLAGGIAHDFNNLLTVITGYCQMLLDQLGAEHPMADDVQQVLKAADRATALTRQLLAFSRRQIVQPKVVDPALLIQDMQPMLQRLLGENARLYLTAESGQSRIRVDPGNLEQVIVNLVVNARDAMPDGGAVRINIRTARTGTESHPFITLPEDDYVVIDVADTGTGMPESVIAHLFEPFFTTKEKGRGTGLGLSTSYGIIRQNRGEILVRSVLGAGSTFSIWLPCVTDPADAASAGAPESDLPRGAETILLAEDEDGVRKVVADMLRQQGYRVLPAVDGMNALELARRSNEHIDLLVTDMVMPGMGGRELASQLMAEFPHLRVLFVSGYTDDGIFASSVTDHNTAFLHKPFSAGDLARKVREVLEQHQVPSPAGHSL